MNRTLKHILAAAMILPLAACGTLGKGGKGPPCPQTGFMTDAATAVFFTTATPYPTDDDVGVRAILSNLRGTCDMSDKGKAKMDMTFDVTAVRTPAGKLIPKQNLSYFVALLAPDETVLARENFYTSADFSKGDRVVTTETREIEAKNTGSGANVSDDTVLIGFTLTPQQLAFNRETVHPGPPPSTPKTKHKKKKSQPAK